MIADQSFYAIFFMFFYPTASATAYSQRPKFVRAEHKATAVGENCAYGPTLLYRLILKKMEKYKISPSTEWFDLVVRGVLVPTLGCLGMIFNIMIIIVLRRPEFTKFSINLIMLCKFTEFLVLIII